MYAGKTQYWADPWEGTSMQPEGWARAIYSGVYSYAGWSVSVYIL